MAKQPIPATTSDVHLQLLPNSAIPIVSSREVARHFGKKHKNVLQEIENLCAYLPPDFHGLNFQPMQETIATHNNATRNIPAYQLTRDGFSLLAMGFTGRAAIAWKLKYIEAFNALEKNVLEQTRAKALEEGAHTALAITPLERERVRKIAAYLRRGLTQREIAKLMDLSRRTVQYHIHTCKTLGLGCARELL